MLQHDAFDIIFFYADCRASHNPTLLWAWKALVFVMVLALGGIRSDRPSPLPAAIWLLPLKRGFPAGLSMSGRSPSAALFVLTVLSCFALWFWMSSPSQLRTNREGVRSGSRRVDEEEMALINLLPLGCHACCNWSHNSKQSWGKWQSKIHHT